MTSKILIVDDSPSCLKLAYESVKTCGTVDQAKDLTQAREFLKINKYDLILLDINLPDGNGVEFCQEIGNSQDLNLCHILMVTGENAVTTKVTSFHLGVEDYLTKPYSPLELRARAERLLKRKHFETNYLHAPNLRLDLNLQLAQVLDCENWVVLQLTGKEFQILKFLLENRDQTLSRDRILDKVWGVGTFIGDRVVDTHISSLRKKLGSQSVYLINLRGFGYRWMNSIEDQEQKAA